MQGSVQHIGPSHVGDCLDSTLSHPILVLCTNTAEAQYLTKASAMLTKLCGTENTVVRMISLNGNTNIHSLRFQKHFTMESVTGSSGQLVVHQEKGAAMVDINGATCVAIVGGTVSR